MASSLSLQNLIYKKRVTRPLCPPLVNSERGLSSKFFTRIMTARITKVHRHVSIWPRQVSHSSHRVACVYGATLNHWMVYKLPLTLLYSYHPAATNAPIGPRNTPFSKTPPSLFHNCIIISAEHLYYLQTMLSSPAKADIIHRCPSFQAILFAVLDLLFVLILHREQLTI